MIVATAGGDGPAFSFNTSVRGLAIYLDNFAIIGLAKGDSSRRRRFVSALRAKGDLLFSVSNAADLSGLQGNSRTMVGDFLDELGPHWFPVELNPADVLEREKKLEPSGASCLCARFLKDYFVARLRDCHGLINLSDDFFRLSAVLDWVGPQRPSIARGLANLDAALVNRIKQHRATSEKDAAWLDRTFPILPFNPLMPATFTYVNLVRTLIVESRSHGVKKGDGLDFCHAVIGSAFASVAALDKHWKRRLETMPKPNKLAPIYYANELDQMVGDIESYH